MKSSSQKIMEQALTLPEEERLEMATRLLASVDGDGDAEWEAGWLAELERRRHALENDPSSASGWPEARARILARLGYAR